MLDKPKKESRWERFKEWCYYNDFWQKVGAAILVLALIGGVIAFAVWVHDSEPHVTEGVIIDMGHYVPGRSMMQYGCWIKIRSDDGAVRTWDVSDTVYEKLSIGDWVKRSEVKP